MIFGGFRGGVAPELLDMVIYIYIERVALKNTLYDRTHQNHKECMYTYLVSMEQGQEIIFEKFAIFKNFSIFKIFPNFKNILFDEIHLF